MKTMMAMVDMDMVDMNMVDMDMVDNGIKDEHDDGRDASSPSKGGSPAAGG